MTTTDPLDIEHTLSDQLDSDTAIARVYDTVTNIHEPAPLEDICALAMTDESETKPILDVFVDMGVITVNADDSDTPQYKRNEVFFRCRRATELASEFTKTELDEMQTRFESQIDAFQTLYDTDTIDGIGQYSSNKALRGYVQQDIEQWKLMQQTCDDIDVAKALCGLSSADESESD